MNHINLYYSDSSVNLLIKNFYFIGEEIFLHSNRMCHFNNNNTNNSNKDNNNNNNN